MAYSVSNAFTSLKGMRHIGVFINRESGDAAPTNGYIVFKKNGVELARVSHPAMSSTSLLVRSPLLPPATSGIAAEWYNGDGTLLATGYGTTQTVTSSLPSGTKSIGDPPTYYDLSGQDNGDGTSTITLHYVTGSTSVSPRINAQLFIYSQDLQTVVVEGTEISDSGKIPNPGKTVEYTFPNNTSLGTLRYLELFIKGGSPFVIDGVKQRYEGYRYSLPLVPTAGLTVKADTTAVRLTATSTTAGAGDVTIKYVIYSDSAMTSPIANSANHTLADGGTDTWNRDYEVSGHTAMTPGTTYYVAIVNQANSEKMATGQFTVPHYTTKVFKEWQRNGVRYNFSTPVTENITLVGAWNEVYQVTFKDADATVLSTQNVVQGSATGLVMPPDPTYATGFVGWECSLDGHIWDNATEDVISEMTLTAKYTGSHAGGGGN